MTITDRINYLNIAAMPASAALAVFIPFELVLLSYAILGPLHYLTEISWLDTKRFFTLKKYDYLLIAAVAIICFVARLPYANLIFYTFGLSFILLVIPAPKYRLLAFIVLIAAGYFLLTHNLIRTIIGLYIPTLIHVYIFTGAFILFGALKDRNISGYLAFFIFLVCPVVLCFIATGYHTNVSAWAMNNYGDFTSLNITTLRSPFLAVYTNPASILLTRIIAFAYTYHYINWFSKTGIIKWHRLSLLKATIIGLIWAASVALYFFNYQSGIKWLFIMSLAHVILEFPLNHKSFMGIGRELRGRVHS